MTALEVQRMGKFCNFVANLAIANKKLFAESSWDAAAAAAMIFSAAAAILFSGIMQGKNLIGKRIGLKPDATEISSTKVDF